jgi:hypothetical protein
LSAEHASALQTVQLRLEQFYELERAPDVLEFVRTGGNGCRETLLLRQTGDALELALVLPPASTAVCELGNAVSDRLLQLIEGVSHFVYIAERARTGLQATRLELELQAEVDKFVVLALDSGGFEGTGGFRRARVRSLHGELYQRVRFLHPANSEAGKRYRLANELAARFVRHLLTRAEPVGIRQILRRFYRLGQMDKIRLAQAA